MHARLWLWEHPASFPELRPRRLRGHPVLRDLLAEARLHVEKLVQPIFIREDLSSSRPLGSLPGLSAYGPESPELIEYIASAMDDGVKAFLVFGTPRRKARLGDPAYDVNGVVQRSLRYVRRELGEEPLLVTDLCLCSYTDHGHCGVPRQHPRKGIVIENDETLGLYARIAVAQAEAGSDVIAPSGMMDGQVGAIRRALDDSGFSDVAIMSYSVKYASAFYGPFREAVDSSPRFGDRSTYQMDPRNKGEALKEALLDIGEGADILMVKPALAYLDVLSFLRESFPHYPLAAYSVSGEYLMVEALAEKGMADRSRLHMEVLTSIARAGADFIITYWAREAARLVKAEGG